MATKPGERRLQIVLAYHAEAVGAHSALHGFECVGEASRAFTPVGELNGCGHSLPASRAGRYAQDKPPPEAHEPPLRTGAT